MRVSITGSSVVMGSSLGLRHTSSLPMGEACASSRMGFRAPESLKGSFTGVGGGLACSLLELGHSPTLPVEEACASSGVRFRAPESPKGSFVGVDSGLACSSLRLGHSPSLPVEEACASSGVRFGVPESLKGSSAGVGSELARGRSSVEGVKIGREDLLRGRDQDRGTVAFSGEGGQWLCRPSQS